MVIWLVGYDGDEVGFGAVLAETLIEGRVAGASLTEGRKFESYR
jgi:hypothetical protein